MANKKRSKITIFGEIDRGGDGALYGEIDRTSEGDEMHVVIRKLPDKPAYVRVELDGETIINGYMADTKTQTVLFKERRSPVAVKGSGK